MVNLIFCHLRTSIIQKECCTQQVYKGILKTFQMASFETEAKSRDLQSWSISGLSTLSFLGFSKLDELFLNNVENETKLEQATSLNCTSLCA